MNITQSKKQNPFIVSPAPKTIKTNTSVSAVNKTNGEIQPVINQDVINNDAAKPCKSMWKRKILPAICTFGRVCKGVCIVIGHLIAHTLTIVAGLISGAIVAASFISPIFLVLCLLAPPTAILINFLPIIIPICAIGAIIVACAFEGALIAQTQSYLHDIQIEKEKKIREQKRAQIEMENKMKLQKEIKNERANEVIKETATTKSVT